MSGDVQVSDWGCGQIELRLPEDLGMLLLTTHEAFVLAARLVNVLGDDKKFMDVLREERDV